MIPHAPGIAIDVGAGSGKMISFTFDGNRIHILSKTEFVNNPVRVGNSLHWDEKEILRLIISGLKRHTDKNIASIGIDTWGTDYGLLNRHDALIGRPYHYRDRRTDSAMKEILSIYPPKTLFEQTGCDMNNNYTMAQLYVQRETPELAKAKHLLFMPGLLAFMLCGEKNTDSTIASTSQLMDASFSRWNTELFERLGLPLRIMGEIQPPGSILGGLKKELRKKWGIGDTNVVSTAGHDTACAVMAIPDMDDETAFISAGTTIIVGTVSDMPVYNDGMLQHGFKNAIAADGRFLVYKNINGFFILNECLRHWRYASRDISKMEGPETIRASELPVIDSDATLFSRQGNMPEKVRTYCRQTGQRIPEMQREIYSCVLLGFAKKIEQALQALSAIMNKTYHAIWAISGGSRSRIFTQYLCELLRQPILTGLPDATLIGNAMLQLYACGKLSKVSDISNVVRASFEFNKLEKNKVYKI